jgi:glyceraldehyde-3-phosphate dehydrogenase (NADP+)
MKTASLLEQHRDELARLITAESGMPIADATVEVGRAVQTFIIAAEESKRLTGEMVPIEAAPGQAQPHGLHDPRSARRRPAASRRSTRRSNIGRAQCGAGRVASGNTVVLKPSDLDAVQRDALSSELLLEAGRPPEHINLIHAPRNRRSGPWARSTTQTIVSFTFTCGTNRPANGCVSALDFGRFAS